MALPAKVSLRQTLGEPGPGQEQPVMRPSLGVGFYRACGGRLGAVAKARRRRLGWKGHELHADSPHRFGC